MSVHERSAFFLVAEVSRVFLFVSVLEQSFSQSHNFGHPGSSVDEFFFDAMGRFSGCSLFHPDLSRAPC